MNMDAARAAVMAKDAAVAREECFSVHAASE